MPILRAWWTRAQRSAIRASHAAGVVAFVEQVQRDEGFATAGNVCRGRRSNRVMMLFTPVRT
jgi:hypothetical protein